MLVVKLTPNFIAAIHLAPKISVTVLKFSMTPITENSPIFMFGRKYKRVNNLFIYLRIATGKNKSII